MNEGLKYSDQKVAILLHEGLQGSKGKTGLGLLRYSDAEIVVVIDQQSAGQSLSQLTNIPRDLPIVPSVSAALSYHPDILVIGIAPSGGALPDAWWQEVKQGVAAGLSVVNGLHTPMATDPELQSLLRTGQKIWDLRQEPSGLTIAEAKARQLSCLRVLTVGTDMAIGKMSSSLELHRASLGRGMRSQFLGTGQTGIMIAGRGVPLDAVRVDFAAGAVEQAVMQLGPNCEILHIEGQGSLLHPGSTATLPLIRGSQPTHLILVHRWGQTHLHNCPDVKIPPLPQVIELYKQVASVAGAVHPVQVVAVALNTAQLSEAEAQRAIEQTKDKTGLPCSDPVRYHGSILLGAIKA